MGCSSLISHDVLPQDHLNRPDPPPPDQVALEIGEIPSHSEALSTPSGKAEPLPSSRQGHLQVEVLRCGGLLPTENNFTTSDPFVRLAVGPKPRKKSEWHSTKHREKTLEPSWVGDPKARFTFAVQAPGGGGDAARHLHFEVRELDRFGSDDDLGEVSIDWAEVVSADGGMTELTLSLDDPAGKVDSKAVGVAEQKVAAADQEVMIDEDDPGIIYVHKPVFSLGTLHVQLQLRWDDAI